ncbi:hypothetical protein AMECASPLE_031558 [Ameca splendens]|uniref:Secreted protein n=1 Tax=Ameca splendens TaxID=208324 RepID=A0ABV1ACP7_9TELE
MILAFSLCFCVRVNVFPPRGSLLKSVADWPVAHLLSIKPNQANGVIGSFRAITLQLMVQHSCYSQALLTFPVVPFEIIFPCSFLFSQVSVTFNFGVFPQPHC